MKNFLIVTLILGVVMLALPMTALKPADSTPGKQVLSEQGSVAADEPPPPAAYKSFNIKLTENGKIKKISAQEYVIGVVSAEMPAEFSEEALKAQAVAAYTFACYRKSTAAENFDLTDDPQTDQCYIDNATADQRWGQNAEKYRKKITAAVKETEQMILTYNGAIALSCYHSMSSGKTESCRDVWGSDLAYLTPVESVGDKLAENYLATKSLAADEVSSSLSLFKTAEGEHKEWFKKSERTDSGRVKSIFFCGTEITGGEIAAALDLRSANFEITATDTGFDIITKGYGHGVGMSQHGAEYMAKQGSDFKEILSHYYPGCKLQKAKS